MKSIPTRGKYLVAAEQEEPEGGALGKEGDGVKMHNSFPLKTHDQGQDLTPDPESLRAAGPEN
ncbi:hypothetical protein DSO57_1038695 [Entomophthora muscae]|uniref:Uncharacterized protein n=1 Tax=Entomophthora muscae TaxID=34485 RepID=A0ACC2RDD5_9FUNG|nr:hypothetical protein DSO57_1038695 [Entomophthora muscae]